MKKRLDIHRTGVLIFHKPSVLILWFFMVVCWSVPSRGQSDAEPMSPVGNSDLVLPCKPLVGHRFVTIDLQEAPIADFVRFVSCLTEQNMVYDPAILAGKTVTIIGPKQIRTTDLGALLRTILADWGLETKKQGGFYRIAKLDPPANTGTAPK